MSETETKAKRETVYTPVQMEDGRTVQFAGNRQADKTVDVNPDTGAVTLRIDFRNGKSITLDAGELSRDVQLLAMGHGLSQKVGDSYASEKDADDMFLAAEDMVKRLKTGDWRITREAGDSMAGASIVIRAICEVTGKSVDVVKGLLDRTLDEAKARGEKLSRQELYKSFRAPGTKVAEVIKRMEEEKASKSTKVDTSSLLAQLG